MIKIQVQGSFKQQESKEFSAMRNGHASAVAAAIEWLSRQVLPNAIQLDHELHEQGDKPDGDFGC